MKPQPVTLLCPSRVCKMYKLIAKVCEKDILWVRDICMGYKSQWNYLSECLMALTEWFSISTCIHVNIFLYGKCTHLQCLNANRQICR